MKNYRKVNTCLSCRHVFRMHEFDSCASLYCNMDGDRPRPCGSAMLRESFYIREDGSYRPDVDALRLKRRWEAWAASHGVDDHGICDNYQGVDYGKVGKNTPGLRQGGGGCGDGADGKHAADGGGKAGAGRPAEGGGAA